VSPLHSMERGGHGTPCPYKYRQRKWAGLCLDCFPRTRFLGSARDKSKRAGEEPAPTDVVIANKKRRIHPPRADFIPGRKPARAGLRHGNKYRIIWLCLRSFLKSPCPLFPR